jgi:hypothetical protein
MQAYGIEFSNRAKQSEGDDPEWFEQQFRAFAFMCWVSAVAGFVNSVDYTSNTGTFHIDVDEEHKFTDVGGVIDFCANKTLCQYEIFGMVQHKDDLDEEIGE